MIQRKIVSFFEPIFVEGAFAAPSVVNLWNFLTDFKLFVFKKWFAFF